MFHIMITFKLQNANTTFQSQQTSSEDLFNPQQEVELRNWMAMHQNGQRMKRGAWPIILKWISDNWKIQVSSRQINNWLRKVDNETSKHEENNGKWDENEDNLLYKQYPTLQTCWSKYKIPGRSSKSINRRFVTLSTAAVAKLKEKSFTHFVLDSLNALKESKVPATKSNLIMDLRYTTGIESDSVITFALNMSLAQLKLRGKVVKIDQEYAIDESANKKKTKKLRKQPLRHPLNKEEELHIRLLKEESILNAEKNKHLTWLNDDLMEVTTTHVGPRKLEFKSTVAAVECINEVNKLINGNEKDLYEEDDEDYEDDENEEDEEDEEDEDDEDAVYDHRPHVFGFLRLVNSDKVLFFYTAKVNVYYYIANQISAVLTLRGCPSWLQAIATDRLSIDWKGITLIAKADGMKAARRLKLATVNLASTPCYNVRRENFVPITNGFTDYRQTLRGANVNLNEDKIEEMRKMENSMTSPVGP